MVEVLDAEVLKLLEIVDGWTLIRQGDINPKLCAAVTPNFQPDS